MYRGNKVLTPSTILRRNPIGFVVPVPEGVVTNLSVMSTERTGEQLLLLRPMRFNNSDCQPNCEYDFSSVLGIVQFRVKRRINPDDEIFVIYGSEFFDENVVNVGLAKSGQSKKKEEILRLISCLNIT